MKILFDDFRNLLKEAIFRNDSDLVIEANEGNGAGAGITELFPCFYFTLKKNNNEVYPITADDIRTGNERYTQFLKNLDNAVGQHPELNPFAFVGVTRSIGRYLKNTIFKSFLKSKNFSKLDEKLKQAWNVYLAIDKQYPEATSVRWCAFERSAVGTMLDGIPKNADMCIELGTKKPVFISLKADNVSAKVIPASGPATVRGGTATKSPTLRSFFDPVCKSYDAKYNQIFGTLRVNIDNLLVGEGFDNLTEPGTKLSSVDQFKSVYVKVRNMILNGVDVKAAFEKVRADMSSTCIDSLIKTLNNRKIITEVDLRLIIKNAIGIEIKDGGVPNVHVWRVSTDACYDRTALMLDMFENIDYATKFNAQRVGQSNTYFTLTWKSKNKPYVLWFDVRPEDSFRSRTKPGRMTASLETILDAERKGMSLWSDVPPITSSSDKKRFFKQIGFFKTVSFAMLYKAIETWKIVPRAPQGVEHKITESLERKSIFNEEKQNMNNNTKITITVGQLRRLIRESNSRRRSIIP